MDPRPPHRPPPPVLNMTPEGEFRDTPHAVPGGRGGGTMLDRALARLGGMALLVALGAGGLLLAALALVFIGLLLPVLLIAGGIGAVSLWWRLRRAGGAARPGGDGVRFVVIRR